MATTLTSIYGFDKPATGDTGWGPLRNTNVDDIDAELARTRQPFLSPSVGATTTLDLNQSTGARLFVFTVNQVTTIAFSNIPSASFFCRWWALITNGGAFAVTWPGAVSWLTGAAPTLQASGVDLVEFVTRDGGGTVYARHHGPYQNASRLIEVTRRVPSIVGQSTTDVGTGGATAETDLHTITVPANTMGANGSLRITGRYSITGTANTKTIRVKFGGTTFASYAAVAADTITPGFFQIIITNRNATNSQINGGAITVTTAVATVGTLLAPAEITGAIDTTVNQNVVVSGQTVNAADEITARVTLVEVLPG